VAAAARLDASAIRATRQCVAAREMFEEIFQKTIEQRRASGDESKDDFLQVLMEAKYGHAKLPLLILRTA